MLNKLKKKINKLRSTGFFSIFVSSVICKVLVFLGGTIIVRVLSKTEYGTYAYILNCVSMLCLLNDFGASSAALQFLTENSDDQQKQGAIFKYAFKISIISTSVSCFLILLSPLFYPFTIELAKKYIPFMCLIPVINIISGMFPIVLRSNLDNRRYAKLQVYSTLANYIFLISLSFFFKLNGAIIAHYIYSIFILVLGFYYAYTYIKKYDFKNKLLTKEKKEFIKFSISSQINNSIGGLLIIIDTFLIGLLIASEDVVATYKVASAIPHALTFISSCVAIYMIPFFVKNNKNIKWIKCNYKRLLLYGSLGYGLLCIALIVLSKFIIGVVFGKQYLEAVPAYIVLLIGLFFSSSFKVPCANIIYAMKKVKVNIITNAASAVCNFILNIYFIKKFGYLGAALTTTFINIFISIIYIFYLRHLLKCKEKEI